MPCIEVVMESSNNGSCPLFHFNLVKNLHLACPLNPQESELVSLEDSHPIRLV